MKTNEIIAGLRNCVTTQFTGCKDCPAYCRSSNCLNRLHTAAADTLQLQQARIAELEAELKDERHRHDRYVDFELAQAKELEQLRAERRWIPVTERLPDLIPCDAGTAYSEAVNVLTDGRKVLTAIWNGERFLCDADYWEAWDEKITHWTPVLLPLPEPPKEGV